MASRKNKWRKRGRLEFRRETKRFSDGSPWSPATDILFVRIKGKACSTVEPFDWSHLGEPKKTVCVSAGTYRAASPVQAAHLARDYVTR